MRKVDSFSVWLAMGRLGRPRHPSSRSSQLIYSRLSKGPFWLDDWKSTGINSRGTVYECLEFLKSRNLVKVRREGHKKVYDLAPLQNGNGTVTIAGINWQGILYPLSRKEKRQIRSRLRKNIKEEAKMKEQTTLVPMAMEEMWQEIDEIMEHPESQEVYEALKEIGIDWEKIPILNLLEFLLYPHQEEILCMDCLRRGDFVYGIPDPKTREIICPKESIVIGEMQPEHTLRPMKGQLGSLLKKYKDEGSQRFDELKRKSNLTPEEWAEFKRLKAYIMKR